jgi:hypothetical protein
MKKTIFTLISLVLTQVLIAQINSKTEIFSMCKSIRIIETEPCSFAVAKYRTINFNTDMKVNIIDFSYCKKAPNPQIKYFFIVILDGQKYFVQSGDLSFNYNDDEIYRFFKKIKEDEKLQFNELNKKLNVDYYLYLKYLANEKKKEDIEVERLSLEQKRKTQYENGLKKASEKAIKDSITVLENQWLIVDFEKNNRELNKTTALKIQNAQKSGGVLITKFEVNTNDYDATSVSFSVLNISAKRIKYISFHLQAFNGVDDPIYSPVTVKGVGFVDINDIGAWEFKNVWFNKSLESVKILKISIIYEDGSIKNVNEVSNIIVKDVDEQIALLNYKPIQSSQIFGSLCLEERKVENSISCKILFFPPIINPKPENIITITLNDIPKFLLELEEIIIAKKNNKVKINDMFVTTEFISMIYVKSGVNVSIESNERYTLVSFEHLEQLKNKLSKL